MAPKKIPSWNYWHPLSIWKTLAIIAVAQIAAHIAFAAAFSVLSISMNSSNFGAGVGGGIGAIIVMTLAKKGRAAEAESATSGTSPE